jgi:hypothetical protein
MALSHPEPWRLACSAAARSRLPPEVQEGQGVCTAASRACSYVSMCRTMVTMSFWCPRVLQAKLHEIERLKELLQLEKQHSAKLQKLLRQETAVTNGPHSTSLAQVCDTLHLACGMVRHSVSVLHTKCMRSRASCWEAKEVAFSTNC